MRSRAFTLIELLVTISIIAILMAIMFPVFVQAKLKVQGFLSSSNMRQIGMGLNMYLDDHGSYFPIPHNVVPGSWGDMNGDGVFEWYEAILLYIDDRRILRAHADYSDPRERPSSYVDNSWFDYRVHLSYVVDPTATIYAAERRSEYPHDYVEWWFWQDGVWPPDPANVPRDAAAQELAIERYHGLNNYLYVDGHARNRDFDQTWSPRVAWWPEAPTQ